MIERKNPEASNPPVQAAIIAGILCAVTGCMPPQDDDKSAQNDAMHSNYLGMDQQALYQQPALAVCAGCHLIPGPAELPRHAWGSIIESMKTEMQQAGMSFSETDFKAITDYYEQRSPDELPELPPFNADDKLKLQAIALGEQPRLPSAEYIPTPASFIDVTSINITDLDKDGHPDVLATRRWGPLAPDADTPSIVQWHYRKNGKWEHRELASLSALAHTEVLDHNGDGHPDIVVADLGDLFPSPDNKGQVVLLENDGAQRFKQTVLLRNVGRVADVRPGNFDGDGDIDYVVAIFGYFTPGQIGWLENTGSPPYPLHTIDYRIGAVNVAPLDLNGDGRLDFVGLVTQEHEEIVAYINTGKKGYEAFQPHLLFKCPTPLFGSSGLETTDLDQDGDMDIVFTNGDAVNRVLGQLQKRPYHGIQWLENKGGLQFVYHDIARFYGAYRAVTGDMDKDGDRDIVALSAIKAGADHYELIWLENDGKQNFTPHGISRGHDHMGVAAALGDLNEDGRLDILTGGLMGLWLWSRP
jgi:cytochrome c553